MMGEPIPDKVRNYFATLLAKLLNEMKSRKFWALVTGIVVISQALSLGEITQWQAIQALVTALGLYSTGVAVEDGLRR